MAEVNNIPDLISQINDLKRRIESLETSPRAASTSIQSGTLKIMDDAGLVMAEFGKRASDGLVGLFVYSHDGTKDTIIVGEIDDGLGGHIHGINVLAESGRRMFTVDGEGGMSTPILVASWVGNVGEADDANGRKTTTAASYSTLWRINKLFAAGDQFGYNFNLSIPVGTTVDIRIRAVETGGGSPATIASATGLGSGTTQFIGIATVGPSATISGVDNVLGRYFNFSMEMQRTAGAGTPASGPVEQSRFYPV